MIKVRGWSNRRQPLGTTTLLPMSQAVQLRLVRLVTDGRTHEMLVKVRHTARRFATMMRANLRQVPTPPAVTPLDRNSTLTPGVAGERAIRSRGCAALACALHAAPLVEKYPQSRRRKGDERGERWRSGRTERDATNADAGYPVGVASGHGDAASRLRRNQRLSSER